MGVKSLYEYFYKLAYGDKGADKATLVNDCLDVADAEIKANKDAKHTQGTDQGLDTGGANAVVVADVKDAVTKKHTQGTDYSNIVICADYDHPDDAITAISTDNKTLLVTEEETCDTNFTVPANVTVRFERGGKWTINTGITVTFNGQIDAGLWEIFTLIGTGTVVLNSGSCGEAYPEWWGAKGDGTTDDAAIFNSVLTQLNTSEVKTMVLNNSEYLITDTLIMYAGISIIGRNKYPVSNQFVAQNAATKIIFAPTSEKDLFDITQNTDIGYVPKVYIGNLQLYGNTTGGVTFSKYAINSKAAQSVFENLGITRFQDGIYCNFTMINEYRDIYIGLCSHACIYTSTDLNTTDNFYNVIMRQSPWGVILRRVISFRFTNCLFESLTTGGVNIYKESSGINFVSSYSEATPNSSAGDNYGMFYINHDGTTLFRGNISINGGYYAGTHGSFLDVDETSAISKVSIVGTSFHDYVNGIKANPTNTAAYSIYLAGIIANVTNAYVDTAGKLNTTPLGGQIAFPATQIPSANVNTLDDYEEEAWTPALKFGGNSVGMAYTTQAGLYTKIGRQVTVTGYILLSAKGTSTGAAVITGLPFNSKNVDGAYTSVSLWLYSVSFANVFQGTIDKGLSEIPLSEILEDGTFSTLTDTNFINTSRIRISATYFTD